MNLNKITPITKDIIETLNKHSINEYEYIDVLTNILNEVKNNIEVKLSVEDKQFNLLRDMIWYNLELQDGNYTLSDWGTKFPIIMHLCDDTNEIESANFFGLNKELNIIKDKIKEFYEVGLFGKDEWFSDNANVYFTKKKNEKKINSITCKESNTLLVTDEMSKIKIETVINNILDAINNADDKKANIVVEFI